MALIRNGVIQRAILSNNHPSSSFKSLQFYSTRAVEGLTGAIGNTPLIRLSGLSRQTGCDIYAKAEFMNPGGSVKDRAALFLINDAEKRGLLRPGGTVVEGTAGNTGIGLAHVCLSKGYRCVIFMPNNQSQEKIDQLKSLGADVRAVPAVAFTDPMNYNHQAKRYAQELDNAVWTNQFDNTANEAGHRETTGQEIIQQCPDIDAFTCATGTGGTLAGVAQALKAYKKDIQIILADPPGSVLYAYKTLGKLERTGDGSITEGIGQGRITANLNQSIELVDGAVHIPDAETIEMVFRLLHEEGLFVGASSALNVVAAVKVAQTLGRGKRVVTILCDGAGRYASRLFSHGWLESKKLVIPKHYQKYITRA